MHLELIGNWVPIEGEKCRFETDYTDYEYDYEYEAGLWEQYENEYLLVIEYLESFNYYNNSHVYYDNFYYYYDMFDTYGFDEESYNYYDEDFSKFDKSGAPILNWREGLTLEHNCMTFSNADAPLGCSSRIVTGNEWSDQEGLEGFFIASNTFFCKNKFVA